LTGAGFYRPLTSSIQIKPSAIKAPKHQKNSQKNTSSAIAKNLDDKNPISEKLRNYYPP